MTLELASIKALAVALLAAATLIAALAVARDDASLPHRCWSFYVVYLERKLRSMFITLPGSRIAFVQLVATGLVLGLALDAQKPALHLVLLPVLLGPGAYLDRRLRSRLRAIESQVDGFTLSLANALKATPSIGNALSYTQPLLPAPLDEELGLALKEMRLGHSVEQALLGMAGRVRSLTLDAAVSALLVGQQVGGDVPKILEKTAATLREMARLSGVVRAKTAEGKAQLVVLAVFPIAIVLLFDTASRGYFDPLAQSVVGWLVVIGAAVLWIVSLLVARNVLEVDI